MQDSGVCSIAEDSAWSLAVDSRESLRALGITVLELDTAGNVASLRVEDESRSRCCRLSHKQYVQVEKYTYSVVVQHDTAQQLMLFL